VTRHDELVSTCRAELLATGSLRRRLAAVDEVPRGIALQTSMNSHSKLKLDLLRDVQPMELGVYEL